MDLSTHYTANCTSCKVRLVFIGQDEKPTRCPLCDRKIATNRLVSKGPMSVAVAESNDVNNRVPGAVRAQAEMHVYADSCELCGLMADVYSCVRIGTLHLAICPGCRERVQVVRTKKNPWRI